VTRPRPAGEETVQDVQVMLKSDAHHASIRDLKVYPRPLFVFLKCVSHLSSTTPDYTLFFFFPL